ncbi:uncharacterized protein [Apostichopus japonicus]|uniref:uncharacterized protein isoform X3 n=1 Tax=Stichopus japonicus TaxID=307972 RepID=UPI003AB71066
MAPQNAWYQYHCREMDTVLPVYMQQPRRPIQNNINLDVPHAGSSSSNPLVDLREKCKSCNSDVPQTLLRQHVKTCVSRRQLSITRMKNKDAGHYRYNQHHPCYFR